MTGVSIVVPTFDRLPLLREAVASVRAQTYSDWELIIVDDGSTDGTRAYAESLGDPRFRCLRLERGGTLAAVRNAGVEAAAGEMLAFLDSDDVWLPDKLAAQLEAVAAHPGAWCYTGFQLVDAGGWPIPLRAGRWQALDGRIAREILTSEASVAMSTLLVSRAQFDSVGRFDAALRHHMDFDLFIRLALAADATVVDRVLVNIREHAQRYTRSIPPAEMFEGTAHVYGKALRLTADAHVRRAARRGRAYHRARACEAHLAAGAVLPAARSLLGALRDGASPRQLAGAVYRGLRSRLQPAP